MILKLAFKVGDTGVPFSIDDGMGNKELSLFTITSATQLDRTSVLTPDDFRYDLEQEVLDRTDEALDRAPDRAVGRRVQGLDPRHR